MTDYPYQKLIAWQQSYVLCLKMYELTKAFPKDERFALTSQIRRAASSVPINIAEGNTKKSPKDRAHFFEISLASLNELHCELLLARDLRYLPENLYKNSQKLLDSCSFLLMKLLQSIRPSP